MSVNLIGFLGFAGLVVAGVGSLCYAVLWTMRRVNKGRDIY